MIWALLYVVLGLLTLLCVIRAFVWWTSGRFSLDGLDLSGRNIVITGPTSGIGLETARELGRRGANLWLLCRKTERGRRLAAEWGGSGVAKVVPCDLSSLASVRAAAEEVRRSCPRIDVLLLNAGMGGTGSPKPELTEDGLELVMASNYFGHFLLARLLLDKLSQGSRVVSVSSIMHRFTSELPLDNLNFQKSYTPRSPTPYVYSKLAQILFTKELAHRLRDRGVSATAAHPGVVGTNIARGFATVLRLPLFLQRLAPTLVGFLFSSPVEGAQTSLYLAVSPEVEGVSGEYFADCAPTTPSRLALDGRLAKALWDESSRLLRLPTDI